MILGILKRSVVTVLVCWCAIAVVRQTLASRSVRMTGSPPAPGLPQRTSSPFDQDLSEFTPKQAAAFWADWAVQYSDTGPVTNAFLCYQQAIRLDPHESQYHRALATMLFVFRKDAREFYGTDEATVFDMSVREYRKALLLDPENYGLAYELATTHYAIRPFRGEAALAAWQRVLELAQSQPGRDREQVALNLARVHYMLGHAAEADRWLQQVKADEHAEIKHSLGQRIAELGNARSTGS